MAKPNYSFQKRQRDLAKKQKQEEKRLRKANAKFRKRFGYVERTLAERGKTLQESNIQEMEALWQEAKR